MEKRLPGYAYADFFHSEPPTPFFHLLHCNFQNSSLAINGNSKLEVIAFYQPPRYAAFTAGSEISSFASPPFVIFPVSRM